MEISYSKQLQNDDCIHVSILAESELAEALRIIEAIENRVTHRVVEYPTTEPFVEAPAPAKLFSKVITVEETVAALKTFLQSRPSSEAVKLLSEFGASRVTDLPEEQRAEFVARLA